MLPNRLTLMLIPFNQLFARHGIKPKGVLHLGSSIGQEAEEYHRQGIARVIWVEAIPSVFAELRENIKKYPGHLAFNACVSDQNGIEVLFNVANNGGQSSSFLEFGTHAVEHPTVKFVRTIPMKTMRADTLLMGAGLDKEITGGWFLNLDLQGAELLALKGMRNLLGRFDHAYIEVNERELYKGCPLVGDIDHYLKQFGFTRVETKFTNHGWGDAYYARSK